MIREYMYVAINHNDEIQWVKGSSSKTRYFRTDKYLKKRLNTIINIILKIYGK